MKIVVDRRPQIYQVDRATGITQAVIGGVVALACIATLCLPMVIHAIRPYDKKGKEV